MSKKIKIIKTPPGFAPEHIRKQWVGVAMATKDKMDDGTGMRTGTENAGGYKVNPGDALQGLKDLERTEAYDFWKRRLSATSTLIFKAECCEEID